MGSGPPRRTGERDPRRPRAVQPRYRLRSSGPELELEEALRRDGVTIRGASGRWRLNAAATELRQGRLALAKLLEQVCLDRVRAPEPEDEFLRLIEGRGMSAPSVAGGDRRRKRVSAALRSSLPAQAAQRLLGKGLGVVPLDGAAEGEHRVVLQD